MGIGSFWFDSCDRPRVERFLGALFFGMVGLVSGIMTLDAAREVWVFRAKAEAIQNAVKDTHYTGTDLKEILSVLQDKVAK